MLNENDRSGGDQLLPTQQDNIADYEAEFGKIPVDPNFKFAPRR